MDLQKLIIVPKKELLVMALNRIWLKFIGGLQSRLNIAKLVNKFCCEENNGEKGRINRIGSEESFLSDSSLPISCGNKEGKRI